MRRRAALAALLASLPPSAGAVQARLELSLLSGAGGASDLFVGAGLGSDAFVQIVPAARLDVSLAPSWKLGATSDLAWARFRSSELTSVLETGSLEARWLSEAVDATLSGTVENARYSFASPIDPSIPGSPQVVAATAGRGAVLLRARGLGLEWRAAATAASRTSTGAAGEDVPERDYALLAGISRALGPSASVAATYRVARDDSTSDDFALLSHAVFVVLGARAGAFDLGLHLQAQTARFASGVGERFGSVTLTVARPIADRLDLEATYSFAANDSDDPSRGTATRHLGFVALRWRAAELRW